LNFLRLIYKRLKEAFKQCTLSESFNSSGHSDFVVGEINAKHSVSIAFSSGLLTSE